MNPIVLLLFTAATLAAPTTTENAAVRARGEQSTAVWWNTTLPVGAKDQICENGYWNPGDWNETRAGSPLWSDCRQLFLSMDGNRQVYTVRGFTDSLRPVSLLSFGTCNLGIHPTNVAGAPNPADTYSISGMDLRDQLTWPIIRYLRRNATTGEVYPPPDGTLMAWGGRRLCPSAFGAAPKLDVTWHLFEWAKEPPVKVAS